MKRRNTNSAGPAIPPFIDQWGRTTHANPFGHNRPNPAFTEPAAITQPALQPEVVAPTSQRRDRTRPSRAVAKNQRPAGRKRAGRPVAVVVMVLASMVAASTVFAYFLASPGHSAGAATVGTLDAPTGVGTTYSSGTTTVQANWTGVTDPGTGTFGYYVQRFVGSTPSAACGTSPTTLTTSVTCSDTSVPDGTYTYTVTAVYNSFHATSAPSDPVTVVGKVTPTLTATGPAGDSLNTPIGTANITSTLAGASTSPAATGTITFTVFGPLASAPTTCTTGGATVGTATVNGNGTFNPTTGFTPSATGNYWWYASYDGDSHNNTAASTCGSGMSETVVSNPIASAPGISAAVTSGANPTFVKNENVNLTDATTDSGGTVQSVAYFYCAGATGSCTGGTPIGSTTTAAGNWQVIWAAPLPADGPYRIVAVATDDIGNVSATSAATVVTVDTTPPSVSKPSANGFS